MYGPSNPTEKESIPMTITHIHEQVTNILPAKWVDEADVYNALKELGFQTYQEKSEAIGKVDKKGAVHHHYNLKYFVTIK